MGIKKVVKILGHNRTINTGYENVHLKEGDVVELEVSDIRILRSLVQIKAVEILPAGTKCKKLKKTEAPKVEEEKPAKEEKVEYLVMKKGSKRALRVLGSDDEAKKFIASRNDASDLSIKERKA